MNSMTCSTQSMTTAQWSSLFVMSERRPVIWMMIEGRKLDYAIIPICERGADKLHGDNIPGREGKGRWHNSS
jgi:hypothetical protein